ncbi:hypothetical protein HMPREF1869_00078 [Bacteroidales bacterium KA00251]|nr:hypothetical protein HMPREF1869_00078 [Bacteroidales bacterium KA00251]
MRTNELLEESLLASVIFVALLFPRNCSLGSFRKNVPRDFGKSSERFWKKFREILGNVPRGFGKSSERFWEMFREIKRKPPEPLLKVQEVLNECFFSPFLEGAKEALQ